MLNKFKKIEKRDDGYLKLQLKRFKDYDDFVFTKMKEEEHVLEAIKDVKSKVTFYYDLTHMITLKEYLNYYVFDRDSLLDFLIELYRSIVVSKTMIPLLINVDHVYIHDEQGKFYFVGLTTSYDVNQNDHQCYSFSLDVLKMIQTKQYDVLGFYYDCLKDESISFHKLLSLLQDYRSLKDKKLAWYQKIWVKKQAFVIKDVIKAPIYIRCNIKPSRNNDHDTVVLLSDKAYLQDDISGQMIMLNQDDFKIGRNDDNDLVINNHHISAYHASYDPNKKVLYDLNSSNGTFVNQKRITKQQLKDLDQISFAKVCYTYHEK